MDSRRLEVVATLPARHLGVRERLWRAFKRMAVVSFVGLLCANMMILVLPVPHLHLCSLPLAIILGPLVGYVTWRDSVLVGKSEIACPRCGEELVVPDQLPGWPARFNCEHCGIMVELKLAK